MLLCLSSTLANQLGNNYAMFFSQAKTPPTYFLIDSIKKVDWLRDEILKESCIGFDIETNYPTNKGVDVESDYPEQVCGISFAWGRNSLQNPWKPGMSAYVPLTKADDSPYWGEGQQYVLDQLKIILESDIEKVAHNGKFDTLKLALLLDIYVQGFVFDTMLAVVLLDEERKYSSHALKSDFSEDGKLIKLGVADAYLDTSASLWKEDLKSALLYYDNHLRRYSKVPINILAPYAMGDCDLCLSLRYVFEPKLEAEGLTWVFNNIVMPLSNAITLMELNGMPLDVARARRVYDEQSQIMLEAQQEVWQVLGKEFNVGSNDQLGKLLFEDLKLPGQRGERGKWSVDEEVLETLDHPVVKPILKYRRAQKIGSTYAGAALRLMKEVSEDGTRAIVRPNYSLDTVTGRLRCSNPNMQNAPRPENGGSIVKSLWCTRDDYRFIFKDYGQIEIRIAAHLSQEPVWVDSICGGVDLHSLMAKKVYKLDCEVDEVKKKYPEKRSSIKTLNFKILYGGSSFSLSKDLGISVEEADKLINEDYFGVAYTLKGWLDSVKEFVVENGYITNLFGRRRHMPDAMVEVPKSAPWPDDSVRPNCYRKGPYPMWLGIDPEDMYSLDDLKIKQLIKAHGKVNDFTHCLSCPYVSSCMINREVKHVRSKVSHLLRQAVNYPIQSSSADLASSSLVQISNILQNECYYSYVDLFVHDEICVVAHVSEVEKVDRIMDDVMINWARKFANLSVPLEVDTAIVQRWSDKYAH